MTFDFYVPGGSSSILDALFKGIQIQKKIVSSLQSPAGLAGIFFIVIVFSLYIWVKRISQKGEVFNFIVWCILSMFILGSLYSKVNFNLFHYDWERERRSNVSSAEGTGVVEQRAQMSEIPAFNAFYASASKIISNFFKTVMDAMVPVEVDIDKKKVCSSVKYIYAEAFFKTLDNYTEQANYTRVFYLVNDLRSYLQKYTSLYEFELPPQIELPDAESQNEDVRAIQTYSIFSQNVKDIISSCSGYMDSKSLELHQTGYINDEILKDLLDDIEKKIAKSLGTSAAELASKISEGIQGPWGSTTLDNIIRGFTSEIAEFLIRIQPGLKFKLKLMFLAQELILMLLFILSPFFLIFAIIPTGEGYGIKWKLLFGVIVSFMIIISLYPMILFAEYLLSY